MLPKEKIKELISKAEIREALRLVFESLSPEDSISEDYIITLMSQYATLERNENKDLISFDEAKRERARITHAILEFLNADKADNAVSTSTLDKMIAALPLNNDLELGVLQLVNCDRRYPISQFNENFDAKKEAKQNFQFYFLSGCPDEKPESLAERIIYETIEEEAKGFQSSVHYPFVEAGFKRVQIENLPLSGNGRLEVSKRKFKEYTQKRFAFARSESFEQFIQTGIPKLNYSHVVNVFQITEADWLDDKGEIQKYFEWLITTFQNTHPNVPTFIFFFVSHFPNLHNIKKVERRYTEIVNRLDTFCKTQNTVHITEIAPFESLYFRSWLKKMKIGLIQADQIIEQVYKSLKPSDQLTILDEDGEKHRGFHMKDVEPIQKKIVLHLRNHQS